MRLTDPTQPTQLSDPTQPTRTSKLARILEPRLSKLAWIFAILIAVDIALFFFLDACFPQLKEPLSKKDHFLEHLTSIVFFCAFVVGLFYCWRLPDRQQKLANLPIPGIGLFGFLEEVSYGTKLLGIDSVKVNEVNIDSLHDFVSVIYKELGTYILVLCFLIFFFLFKKYGGRIGRLLKTYPAYEFVAIALIFMFVSGVLFDLYIIYHPVMEEVYELNAGISLLFASLAITPKAKPLQERIAEKTEST